MMPLIVIGADDECRSLLELYAEVGHIEYHPTAEDAHYGLLDAAENRMRIDSTTEGVWHVNVAYGPAAYGQLTTGHMGRETRLPHSGHTLVLGLDLHEAPSVIRMRGGTQEHEQPGNAIWQVAAVVGADLVVDLTSPEALSFMASYLGWKESA